MYWKQLSMKIYFINSKYLTAVLNKIPYMQNTLADCWQNAGKANDTGNGRGGGGCSQYPEISALESNDVAR